jgi:hypothetical protein
MSEVLLINRIWYNGDAGYDDSTVIGYVTSEEAAIKKVARLNDLHEKAEQFKKKISDFVYEGIRPSLAPVAYEEAPSYPKWRPGIRQNEITEEMREERNRIIQIQHEVHARNMEKEQIQSNIVDKLKQAYIVSLNIPPDVQKVMELEEGHDSVLRYSYEKIEELKPPKQE